MGRKLFFISQFFLIGILSVHLSAFDIPFRAIGPVNQSMGGTGASYALDPIGAIYHNPATMGTLLCSETSFGFGVTWPESCVASELIDPFPTLSGKNHSDTRHTYNFFGGGVYLHGCSNFSFGLGVYHIGCMEINYPASATNPALLPPSLGGLGRRAASLDFFQVAPAISYRFCDKFSIGIAFNLTFGSFEHDPFIFASPDNASGSGVFTYPYGKGENQVGTGFQLGMQYTPIPCVHIGAAIQSQQKFNKFRYNLADQLGFPREQKLDIELPLVATVGIAYTGLPCLVVAVDGYYIDYHSADFFGDEGAFDSTARVTGLGWDSVYGVSAGIQYQLSPCLSLRTGYAYLDNPIPSDQTFFNVGTPAIVEHAVSVGASYYVTRCLSIDGSYSHGFEEKISGRFISVQGPLEGSNVSSKRRFNAASLSITTRY